MSVLRKEKSQEEPLTTADIANPQHADNTRGEVATGSPNGEADIDPADRRPPRSASGATRVTDDTYDGEIVNSSVEPVSTVDTASSTPQSVASPRQPANQPYPSRTESARSQSATTATQTNGRNEFPLFAEAELRDFRARWDQVQTSFVDEPRHAVEQADTLVATVVKRIAEQFSEERAKLEKQWDRGDDVSTEDLRQSLRRYRAFFDRLLSF
jgi:hypothetical protein